MQLLPLLHMMLVFIWLGFVLIETIIEFGGSSDAEIQQATKLHYRIDLMLEMPIVLSVLGTGIALAYLRWPLTSTLTLKMILGLIAIFINFYCAILVIQRHKKLSDVNQVREIRQRILKTWVGVPFGLSALYIGIKHALGPLS